MNRMFFDLCQNMDQVQNSKILYSAISILGITIEPAYLIDRIDR